MIIDANDIRFPYTINGETYHVTLRRPTAVELDTFFKNRFRQQGKRFENQYSAAARALVRKVLLDIEGLQFRDAEGQVRPLNKDTGLTEADCAKYAACLGQPVHDWRDLVPVQWQIQWAGKFEETGEFQEAGGGAEDEAPLA